MNADNLQLNCPHDVLIFIVPMTCDLHIATEAGNIMKPADKSLSPMTFYLKPKLLFNYDISQEIDQNTLQNVFIYILLGFLIGFILISIALVYFVIKRRVSVTLESPPNISMDSIETATYRRLSQPEDRVQ